MTRLAWNLAFCSLFSICISSSLFLLSWLLWGWVFLWPYLPVGYSWPFSFSLIFGTRFRASVSSWTHYSPSRHCASFCVINDLHFLSHFSYCFTIFYFHVLCTLQCTVAGFALDKLLSFKGTTTCQERIFYTHRQFYYFELSSLLCVDGFPSDNISSAWRTSLNIFCSTDLLEVNPFNFCLSGKV